MLPSRGLRPAQFAPLASRQPLVIRCNAARKFSSLPHTTSLSAPAGRISPLRSGRWRVGATGALDVKMASSVRYGSWYAPWSWGTPSTPAAGATSAAEHVHVAEFSKQHSISEIAKDAEPLVPTATPELAPTGIDRTATVDGVSTPADMAADSVSAIGDPKTIDELLGLDPAEFIASAPTDPNRLVDHAWHLKDMGLDFGWGMTTTIEKLIETIYVQSGWGWAGSIMLACVVVRCGTFGFQALSSDKMAVIASMTPVTKPIKDEMDAARARGDSQRADMLKLQMAEVMRPYMGGMMTAGGLMVIQGWVGFSAFRLLRGMAALPVPGMTVDGYLWFSDLTVPDPYYILPLTTAAIMYVVFKTGGETGVEQDPQKQKIMSAFAFLFGVITSFQGAGIQLYFLVSGIIGGLTGKLLRNNSFRRFIHIRPMPTPESQALYTKVAKGEMKLQDVSKARQNTIRYSPPTSNKPKNKRNTATLSGINIKTGTSLPAHLIQEGPLKIDTQRPTSDADFEDGPKGNILEKLSYYRRNYRPKYVRRRWQDGMEEFMRKQGYGAGPRKSQEQAKRRKRAEDYEIERRRRFESRE